MSRSDGPRVRSDPASDKWAAASIMMRERIWRSSPLARIDTSSGACTPATSMRRSARREKGPTLSSKAAWKLEPSMLSTPGDTSVTECMIGSHDATA